MDWDELIEAVCGDDRKARLVEVGRAEGGRRGFVWSTGRIKASVKGEKVRLSRIYGRESFKSAPWLSREEIAQLSALCGAWVRGRARWAAFYGSSAGYPGGMGGSEWYQPAGHERPTMIGSSCMGRRRGGQLVGKDEVVPLAAPREELGVEVVAEIWRRGETCGPAGGALVGVRAALGDGLHVDAGRIELRVWRKKREVFLEDDEGPFVAAVNRALGRR